MTTDFERQIQGALRAAIHAHGPITVELVPSAAKRIAGQVRTAMTAAANGQLANASRVSKARKKSSAHGQPEPEPTYQRARNVCYTRNCGLEAVWLIREKDHVSWKPRCGKHSQEMYALGGEALRLPENRLQEPSLGRNP